MGYYIETVILYIGLDMPAPTIANFFGASAQTLTATTSVTASAIDPVLVLKYSGFTAQGWDALVAGNETDPEKWVTAIARRIYDFTTANLDEIPNVAVTAPILGLETRNSALKRRFSYALDIYQDDSGSSAPDPDLV
jgi:hypothetical protein